MKLNKPSLKSLLFVITACLCLFAYAPYNIVILIPFAVIIILLHLENLTIRQSIKAGFVFGFVFFLTQVYYIFYSLTYIVKAGFYLSLFGVSAFSLFLSMYVIIAFTLYQLLKTQSRLFNYAFLFPSCWVLGEWLRGYVLGGYPWHDFGYTLVNNPMFWGYYRTIGEYGVSWLLVSMSGIFLLIGLNYFKKNLITKLEYVLSVVSLAIILLIGYSLSNIQFTHKYDDPFTVSILQGNIAVGTKWGNPHTFSMYKDMIESANGNLIIVPETGIADFAEDLPYGYLDSIIDIAEKKHAELLVGMPKVIDEKGNYVNTATLLTNPDFPYYAKYHLVPYGEYIPAKEELGWLYNDVSLPMVGFTHGAENQEAMAIRNQKAAFNICYENGFARELIHAARNSTIMINLSDMAWYGDTYAKDQHLQMSRVRALENERYFIQVTNSSLSAIINPNGEIQSILPTFRQVIETDKVQGMIGVTPFERFANYPIIILCCFFIFIGAFFNIKKKYEIK